MEEKFTEYVVQREWHGEHETYWDDLQFYDTADEALKRLIYLKEHGGNLNYRAVMREIIDSPLSC